MHHPITSSEQDRLKALASLGVLDTPAEQRFDRITRLAALSFGMPIALVSLVDEQRQWFKSRYGLDVAETPRSIAFCSHTVAQDAMLVVEDTLLDPRFAANPAVTGAPHVRFYAGQPLHSDGQPVGTLCVIDRAPRSLTEEQRQALRDLADLVEIELNHARLATARLMAEQALKALNTELERRVAARTSELERKVDELSREIAHRKEVELSLQDSVDWNRSIVAASWSGFVGADGDGRIVEWNGSAERIFGWARAEALGRSLSELIVPHAHRARHEAGMRRCLETGVGARLDRRLELPALTASGRQITIAMSISGYAWKGKRYFGAFMNDISERIRTQQQLEASREELALSERRLRTITDNVPVLIAHLGKERRYVFANAVHLSWLGKAAEEILGKTMEEAFGADYLAPQAAALERAWRGEASQCEHEIVRKKHTRIAHTTFLPQLRDGAVTGVVVLTLDATASRMHERNLHALAHTDTLTGLPNRRQFDTALKGAQQAARGGRATALLYLDIDHFKRINDRYGHAVGDAVLVEFARRLRAAVRSADLVSRLAGDEFTVLLNDVTGEADVELVAHKILAAMRAPFALEAVELRVGTSIGAALADQPEPLPARLLDTADRALYMAKEAGRGTYALLRVGRSRDHALALAHA